MVSFEERSLGDGTSHVNRRTKVDGVETPGTVIIVVPTLEGPMNNDVSRAVP